jgi:AraC family transcriptional regulator
LKRRTEMALFPEALSHQPSNSNGCVLAFPRAPALGRLQGWAYEPAAQATTGDAIAFTPANVSRRHRMIWRGMSAENLQIVWPLPFEYEYNGPFHLLISYQRGSRRTGQTIVDGGPRSTLHEVGGKLTLVPAGFRLSESYVPRTLLRATAFYIDPRGPLFADLGDGASARLRPRLFFENAPIAESVCKLKTLVDAGGDATFAYAEALGAVLAQELLRLDDGLEQAGAPAKAGLAGWQRRRVADYVEENLAAPIPLATLAAIARLSPFHFARSFKRSFGMPPHRYHTCQRLERAKILLSSGTMSITEIALNVGFGDTSAFTSAFRRYVGVTPSTFRCRLC